MIRRAHPALRELSQTLAILRRQNKVIRDFIRDADTVSAAVEPFKEDVARWAREAADTAGIQAARSEELGRYWNRLPDFLAELEPDHGRARATADEQIPTLRSLERAAPDLERFLRAAEPFARETRGALTALGEAAEAGRGAMRRVAAQEIAELRRLAASRHGWASRCASSSRRSTIAGARPRTTPAAGRGTAGPGQDRLQGRARASPAWRRSGTTSTSRRSASTPSTRSGTCCGSSCSHGGPCAPYVAKPDRGRDQGVQLLARPQPAGRDHARPKPAAATRVGARPSPAAKRKRSGGGAAPEAGAPESPGKPQVRRRRAADRGARRRSRSCSTSRQDAAAGHPAARSRQPAADAPTDQLLDYLLSP